MRRVILAVCLVTGLTGGGWAGGDQMKRVAKELGKKLQKMDKPRVGFLNFPYHDGRYSSGSSILSERLTTCMAEIKGVRIVERSLLKKILEEQHLSETGIMDPGSAQKIGKVLGVDIIITGTLNDVSEKVTELNARAIKADTGEAVAAAQAMVQRTWSDSPKLPRELVRQIPATAEPEDEEMTHESNEAIEVGFPGGGGGGRYGGGFGGSWGGR